jgi:enoyl-[acyl-carrier protein] reductase/trans-2-enoyl-CoA reductase (NAD+)
MPSWEDDEAAVTLEIVSPRIRGFICTNAHPAGCAASVASQVARAEAQRSSFPAGGSALVIGASTGYGLASWIVAAFARRMASVGVFFERPSSEKKTASAGFYNAAAVKRLAGERGLRAVAVNGDAFSNAVKAEVLEKIRRELGPVDLVVYSLASPVRIHPDDGRTIRSTLKPVGQPYTTKSIDLDRGRVVDVTLEPASSEEISDTVAVMGGDDLARWIRALSDAKLLAPAARVLAYSYIGPKLTWPIYRTGTIGMAKADLEKMTRILDDELRRSIGGRAWVSVNAAVVTQASSAIPGVPLYLALANKVLEQEQLLERPIDQILRLFAEHASPGRTPVVDVEGRIRIDDREMRPEIQERIAAGWNSVTTETLPQLADFARFQRDFRQLFGFEIEGVDYAKPVEIDASLS